MIENKEIPSEYVSLRQIWLRGIDDCRRAISQIANIESSSDMKYYAEAGPRTVVHTITALELSLVDYGEATIKTDVEKWKKEYFIPKNNKIWEYKKKEQGEQIKFAGFHDDDDDEPSNSQRWWDQSRLSQELYEEIIQVLNRYGMLFPEPAKGFSNVEMKSV